MFAAASMKMCRPLITRIEGVVGGKVISVILWFNFTMGHRGKMLIFKKYIYI
jgi:hypothetical protein